MSATKSVNGYQIKQLKDGQWWLVSAQGENVAGPFASEAMAVEVASVFEDSAGHASARRNPKS
ncbi:MULTISPECIES: hypothetical protein [Pseudomonas]|jgi:hypothetical protein|uniref:DUF2188 domain-containing protein n=2 Tax=Pseudomonas chlororaphis TaxID=587753 RepID=A0AB34C3H8_9PSED|nr:MULTISPECIES: hypothetical protein [Pseudomonas]AZD02781.1 hypothetical protein C4K27_3587 [Pseudomonas chlororaphis subsp. chlororaphis]AZE30265.1 hypothetical protein C4K07_3480 [Pseudomonas chlororaphis subsp. aureofaciens]AZE36560.1 hypothetical protein C4K06_3527 [Pseudomonas chlororaphis subsp. aureofaciens]AZE42908.1 hypothetical protein C4K05_3568 [Pseudomonas chlororaphis subsp. aureofaciens]KAA5841108.1 hypothetical protein F2A38_16575 [Pseudomonas chlororaphis]